MQKAGALLSFIFILSGVLARAQTCCPYIVSISQIPTNPVETDSICLIADVNLPTNGFTIETYASTTGSLIEFSACYYSGMLTVITPLVDTICIGTLSAGVYTVDFTGLISFNNAECTPSDSNSSSFSFFVSASPVGLNDFNHTRLPSALVLNPDQFVSHCSTPGLLLFDTSGRAILPTLVTRPGLYFLLNKNSNVYLEKILLTDY